MEKYALLTVPLNTLPGGLVPNSFQGNVIDEYDNYTNQIFFTGVVGAGEPNSHTWLVINDKPYDLVLGTSGDQVEAAEQSAFRQVGSTETWENGKGLRLERVSSDVATAAPNTMGFGTAYRLVNIG